MTVEGLIRTLLHGIGTLQPSVLPHLFPERWARLMAYSYYVNPTVVWDSWTYTECLRALRKLLTSQFQSFRFFFFIDGLDECTGDHLEVVALLNEMANSAHIKVCLASRPWTVFKDAFNGGPSLTLQDLTANDISIYIRAKFYNNRGFLQLEKSNSKLAAQLFEEIRTKASGVFLWVRLAVQSLLLGIANGDQVDDLQRRLYDLPADLRKLFQKILASVDPTYRLHSAKLFRTHRAASEHGGISLLQLSFADDPDSSLFNSEIGPLSRDEFVFRMQSMERRLESRTKGLLEITRSFLSQEIEDRYFY